MWYIVRAFLGWRHITKILILWSFVKTLKESTVAWSMRESLVRWVTLLKRAVPYSIIFFRCSGVFEDNHKREVTENCQICFWLCNEAREKESHCNTQGQHHVSSVLMVYILSVESGISNLGSYPMVFFFENAKRSPNSTQTLSSSPWSLTTVVCRYFGITHSYSIYTLGSL